MSVRNAVLVLVAATLVAIAGTLIAGREPGFLLGFFVTIGSVVAALGVRRGAVYLMFPLPAFALFVAAVVTGKIHDSSLTSSATGLGVGFLQWIAHVFFPMVIATIAVLVIAGIRWLLAYQLVTGQFSSPAGRPGPSHGARPVARPDRPDSGASLNSQAAAAPRAPSPPTPDPRAPRPSAPRPGSDDGRPARLSGDQRTARDRWGDPRPPVAGPRPRDGRAAAPAQPRDRTPRPPARPSWDPGPSQTSQPPRPARPPGRGPRGPWDER